MDATIYHGSPLADYLEGHGEAEQAFEIPSSDDTTDSIDVPTYAPREALTSARSQLRRVLTKPLHLHLHRRTPTWDKLQDVCSSTIKTGITKGEHGRFLEQLRYLIIASQLLDGQSRPARRRTTKSFPEVDTVFRTLPGPDFDALTIHGVFATTLFSFSVAWAFHWVRSSATDSARTLSTKILSASLLLCVLVLSLCTYTWRYRSQRLRRNVIDAVSSLISESQTLDGLTSSALTLVQEIEVVARGYEISHVLPPISRLDEQSAERRCLALRSQLASSLQTIQGGYVAAHAALRSLSNAGDVNKYHEIYDISEQDAREASSHSRLELTDEETSLKSLRYHLRRTFFARQLVLCDLLAVSPQLESDDVENWRTVLRQTSDLAEVLHNARATMSISLTREDEKHWGYSNGKRHEPHEDAAEEVANLPPVTPGKERAQAQMRRLDSMFCGIRSLHAKMHVLRDEANAIFEATVDSSELSSALSRQYDTIGAEIRGMLAEWEKGRSTMLLGVESLVRFSSRSSSGLRSPMSPVPSLGGATAVEGSPSDALRALMGETSYRQTQENGISDEEVFEAVAAPRKRMSMTREEKIAKMQEDRRKRATFHEQTNVNTTMLRELETVIKHRPRGRTTSRFTSV